MSEQQGGGPPGFSAAQIAGLVLKQVVGYAKEVGTACVLMRGEETCGALTLGVRCEKCSRTICVEHTYWNTTKAKVKPYCPYCVVQMNEDLFDDA